MESVSGLGSYLINTEGIRKGLPLLFKALDIHTLVDAPCGDFNWMKEVQLDIEWYIGVDIWDERIYFNKKNYGNLRNSFYVRDIVNDILDKADLILCRDCLVHLPFQEGIGAIENFRQSGSKYLAATSYLDVRENKDCARGDWRKINLEFPPYNLDNPLVSIVERGLRCRLGMDDYGKMLSVWPLQ